MKTDGFGKKAAVSLIILFINFIATFIFILHMPEQVPVHFNTDMVCDRTGSRWLFIIFSAVFTTIPAVLYIALSGNEKMKKNTRIIDVWMTTLTLIIVMFNWLILFFVDSSCKNGNGSVDSSLIWILPSICGTAIALIGNYLPTLKQNKVIGYRSGWTLNNPQCWKLTHQLAGRMAFVAGILTFIAGIIMKLAGVTSATAYSYAVILMVAILIIVPNVYSYVHRDDR